MDSRGVNAFICSGDRISEEGGVENTGESGDDLYRVIPEQVEGDDH